MRINRQVRECPAIAFVLNILLVYVMYAVCRIEFLFENWNIFSAGISENSLARMITGALLFDTSAILYTNVLYALMILLPLHLKETAAWHKAARWLFVIVNAIAVIVNLGDSVYFRFAGRRTTTSVFSEFENEGNIFKIFGTELLNHWYLVLLGIVMIYLLWRCYTIPSTKIEKSDRRRYYIMQVLSLLLFIPLCIAGMRGGFTTAVRPITISNANQYVAHSQEAAIVQNTPFCILRTIGKKSFRNPGYFSDEELQGIYSPVFTPSDSLTVRKKNIVILIVESFGREYIGYYNTSLDGGRYKGYTPEVDRLIEQSLTFDETYCNGRKSIDGMPSILSSIPMFVEPFFLTPASMNDVSGIAGELDKVGYQTAFFHGADNGSMGFEAFARKTGFQRYYGRTEFNEDKRFHGDADFDGTWAIWDEPFLQYYALQMTEMKEPFMTAVFTASSHHPFAIPEHYKGRYKDDGPNPIHKCIRYTDHAIGEFFRTASKQPWFRNTIFVLTSDHTNGVDHPEFGTDLGLYCSPIVIYDPSGEIKAERRHGIAQQIDIMPTLLNYLGYPNPYIAFGKDLFATNAEDSWAVNYNNGVYQFVKGDRFVQFNGKDITGIYNHKKDPLLKDNLLHKGVKAEQELRQLKAIIQSYMQRMENNRLVR